MSTSIDQPSQEAPTTTGRWGRYVRLLGLLLLALLLTRIDLSQTLLILSSTHVPLLLLAIATNLPQLGLKALRWRYLLKLQGIPYSAGGAMLAYFASIYVGIMTPGRVGEFVKALYLKQDADVPIGEAASSVLVDRLFDLYGLIGVGAYGLTVFASLVRLPNWVLVLTGLGVLLSLVVLLPSVGQGILQLLERLPLMGRHFERVRPSVQGFHHSLSRLLSPRLLIAILLTIAAHALFYTQCYLLARALDLALGYDYVLFSMALVNLVNLLPVTISGLGTREAILSLLFESAGLNSEAAVAYSVLVILTFYVAAAIIGAAAWWAKPLNTGLVRQIWPKKAGKDNR